MNNMHVCAATAAAIFAGSTALGFVIKLESFETYSASAVKFTDLNTSSHWLANYDDHTVVGSDWDVWFEDTGSNGFSDGDYFGVSTYTGDVGAYTDGVQGYSMSDTDGQITMTFDAVTGATGLSLDLFVKSTGWETSDLINITFGGQTMLDTSGVDINDSYSHLEGVWTTLEIAGSGELTIKFASNAATEVMALDNIQWTGVPAPGALALLGLAGIASRRRRR